MTGRRCALAMLLLALATTSCQRGGDTARADPAKPSPRASVVSSAAPSASANAADLPHNDGTPMRAVLVVLDAKGNLTLEGRPISPTDLDTALRAALVADPKVSVDIAADAKVEYSKVIALVDRLRAVGITKIGFAVSKTGPR